MCGIAGLINYTRRDRGESAATLRQMAGALAHRGPDDEGIWLDPDGRVGLCHRRLAIIDLSPTGAQPMHSASGRYSIVYNGEIYGFRELRDELEANGSRFLGHSDTEVLLEAFEAYGLEGALQRCNGMFAFALYDRVAKKILFARDRIGKKPLYIGISPNAVAFGSELKSIRTHPAFRSAEIDRDALTLYMRHGYVPTPYSIYRDIFKLPHGSWLSISLDQPPVSATAAIDAVKPYWSAFEAAERGYAQRVESADEALHLLDDTLKRAVSERIVSDVPVGVLLSSGIDSSLVTAVMQEVSPSRVKTYTVRFIEEQYNEADVASAIARHLNTDHTEITAEPDIALGMIADLPDVYDEPFADPSQLPTLLVSKLARRTVTVALSGDGGDEFFGGYNRYRQMTVFDRLAKRAPGFALQAAMHAPRWALEIAASGVRRVAHGSLQDEVTGNRLRRLAELLEIRDPDTRYLDFLSVWSHPTEIVPGGRELPTAMTSKRIPACLSAVDRMMYSDMIAYLPDDILVKVDRASMAVGLEMRAPLLDYRFIEQAWRAPRALCFGKTALRHLLSRRLPEEFMSLPKRGFGAPIAAWLRGPLRPWAEDMLSPSRLRRDGIFRVEPIVERWKAHLAGHRDCAPQLWTVLMFNAWHDRWGGAINQRGNATVVEPRLHDQVARLG
ncbi:asparagine synthase (glutamine-hydrolyzing) [Sinorhizobium numidicum]|uniref:asparagine synthase (glutamine-hydrolyzing) n=1 Tax=Sinorhizobium numidicum TaxID=680248 RepID=A0ABY8CQU2_9HYPH|nr:asparagine synthase (glutamine-hydrolyzing) [Sinorhizobium numidicum]WEX75035.1 asparagine synthase (glutamine-hydrolyzing) [Sinorhizobium numidicum]WEX81029.1 asparagine synthase (glutamine-hydrolyzing) [Sinorhizobium numidicum]